MDRCDIEKYDGKFVWLKWSADGIKGPINGDIIGVMNIPKNKLLDRVSIEGTCNELRCIGISYITKIHEIAIKGD